ncbi:MAG: hypothetical protein JJU02_12010 [Cryomorphaceae bacterium]|nr:hypothetical protein [Cryomorphaceae bacterium]
MRIQKSTDKEDFGRKGLFRADSTPHASSKNNISFKNTFLTFGFSKKSTIIMRRLLLLLVFFSLQTCTISHNVQIGSGPEDAHHVYADLAIGYSSWFRILGLFENGEELLMANAKRNMMINRPLKKGEYYTNYTVDFRTIAFPFVLEKRVVMTADVVRITDSTESRRFSGLVYAPMDLAARQNTTIFILTDLLLGQGVKSKDDRFIVHKVLGFYSGVQSKNGENSRSFYVDNHDNQLRSVSVSKKTNEWGSEAYQYDSKIAIGDYTNENIDNVVFPINSVFDYGKGTPKGVVIAINNMDKSFVVQQGDELYLLRWFVK